MSVAAAAQHSVNEGRVVIRSKTQPWSSVYFKTKCNVFVNLHLEVKLLIKAYDKDYKQEYQEEGGELVSGASGEMMTMNNTNQESQCLKTPTKEEEGVKCVHDQEIKNSERKGHDEPVSGMTSGCSGGMLTMSSAARRGFGRAYALQQQQLQSVNGSVLVGPPSGRGFGRGYALMHRRVRNEDPPNQPPNPDPVPVSDSDHEQIPNESASSGTDVTGFIGIMSTMMGRGKGFGRAYALHQQHQSVNGSVFVGPPSGRGFGRGYALLHPSVVNNEQVPETPHDPVTVPDHGPFATYMDNAVNNAKKNVPRLRTQKK